MKRKLYIGLLAAAWAIGSSRAADPAFVNPVFGIVNSPVIDATNVVNYGQFLAASIYPYETSSTLNYTNYGTMVGSVGFRFERISAVTGARSMASSFVNHNPGTIQAQSPLGFGSFFTPLAQCFRAL